VHYQFSRQADDKCKPVMGEPVRLVSLEFQFRPVLHEEIGTMLTFVKNFVRDEEGATMIEYGLMVALIAVVLIGAVTLIGTTMNTKFGEVSDGLTGAGGVEGEG
jgi:pilus assembly protein Flp/PilA